MKRMIDSELIKKLAEVVDNNGDLEAGKLNRKLYYHPIYVTNTTNDFNFQFTIIDNNSSAYTKTSALAKIKDLMDIGAVINVNGFYKDGDNYTSVFTAYKALDVYRLYYYGSTLGYVNLETLWESGNYFYDGVNEIYPNVR